MSAQELYERYVLDPRAYVAERALEDLFRLYLGPLLTAGVARALLRKQKYASELAEDLVGIARKRILLKIHDERGAREFRIANIEYFTLFVAYDEVSSHLTREARQNFVGLDLPHDEAPDEAEPEDFEATEDVTEPAHELGLSGYVSLIDEIVSESFERPREAKTYRGFGSDQAASESHESGGELDEITLATAPEEPAMNAPSPETVPEVTPPPVPTPDVGQPASFSAYPRLDVVGNTPGPFTNPPHWPNFELIVGFREELDERLSNVMPTHIAHRRAGSSCTVHLTAIGAELDEKRLEVLIKLGAAMVVRGRLAQNTERPRVKAEFVYDGELVGSATREIFAAASGETHDPCRMQTDPAEAADLTMSVMHGSDGRLKWTLIAPELGLERAGVETISMASGAPRDFAQQFRERLEPYEGDAQIWDVVLQAEGVKIADAIPDAVFVAIQRLRERKGRPVTVLLLSEEPYIPWELARVPEPLPEPDAPPYFGCQVALGRWVERPKVPVPPTTRCAVTDLYAIQHSGLPHSVIEAKYLESVGASVLPDGGQAVRALLTARRKRWGVHVAAHGKSDTIANEQSLNLADGSRLIPEVFASAFRCGDTPTCAFMFLNACQTGVAGASLGQAAGFPGVLLRSGCEAFVAPLWDVDDRVAGKLAEEFYGAALNRDAKLAETLRAIRAKADSPETRLAYVFYGHPNLKLTCQPSRSATP